MREKHGKMRNDDELIKVNASAVKGCIHNSRFKTVQNFSVEVLKRSKSYLSNMLNNRSAMYVDDYESLLDALKVPDGTFKEKVTEQTEPPLVSKDDKKTNIQYVKVSYMEAIQEFEKGKDLFVRLSPQMMVKVNNIMMQKFEFDANLNIFVQREVIPFRDDAIIVTRHEILARYIKEVMKVNAKHVQYARPHEIEGKHVYGVLPISKMCYAKSVTTIYTSLPESMTEYMKDLNKYKESITKIEKYTVQCERLYVKGKE